MEHSASPILSNLGKAAEKQYRIKDAELFGLLAEFSDSLGAPSSSQGASFSALAAAIGSNESGYLEPLRAVAAQAGDRGALRMATWGGKVNAIRKAVLDRYAKKGEALLEEASIFVCEACGFIYLGKEAPEICPVCKAPSLRFTKQG